MLLLARKAGQSVVIDGNIRVTVDRIRGRVVRLKVEAPREIRVDREEVWNRRACEKPIPAGVIVEFRCQETGRIIQQPALSHDKPIAKSSKSGKRRSI